MVEKPDGLYKERYNNDMVIKYNNSGWYCMPVRHPHYTDIFLGKGWKWFPIHNKGFEHRVLDIGLIKW